MVVNIDASNTARLYNRKDDYQGGIYIYPKSWMQFFKDDDGDKQWFVKRDTGSSYIHVIEFYRIKPRR